MSVKQLNMCFGTMNFKIPSPLIPYSDRAGRGGRGNLPAETLTVNNFFNIEVKDAKLFDFT